MVTVTSESAVGRTTVSVYVYDLTNPILVDVEFVRSDGKNYVLDDQNSMV